MVKYVFRNVEDLDIWRTRYINITGRTPKITARIHGGKCEFTSIVTY